jgi:rod shape determining protein RodA
VTLPLFSYGGSSVVTMLIGFGLLMNVSMRR